MTINWFPGHMNKARRAISEQLTRVDMVVEVLDARLPRSSHNPMLGRMRRGKPFLQLLTKPDLADPKATQKWLAEIRKSGARPMELQATDPGASKRVVAACRELVPRRGHAGFPVRVMIVGIPNVGKSTLFNSLVGKRKAEVRNQPAVTRQTQLIEVPGGLVLVDTPGVLWPKLQSERGAYCLAASGAIRDSVLDLLDVGRFLVQFLATRYPALLAARFRLEPFNYEEFADVDALLARIAERRGCLTKGIGPDVNKAAELLLHEFRAGLIGKISLETPEDVREALVAPKVEPEPGPESDAEAN
jgi:ribosome biogenesis GTPase A